MYSKPCIMHQHAAREKWMLHAVYLVNMSARVLYVCKHSSLHKDSIGTSKSVTY